MIDWRNFIRSAAILTTAAAMILAAGCARSQKPVEELSAISPPLLNDQLIEIDQMSQQGHHDEALAALEPLIEAHPETQRPRGLMTDIFLRKGDYQRALQLQHEIVAAIPDKWYAHYHMGLIHLEYLNQYPDAIASITTALTLMQADDDARESVEYQKNHYNVLVSLAKAYDKSQQYDQALAVCDRILELRPGDPWTTTFRSMVAERAHKAQGNPPTENEPVTSGMDTEETSSAKSETGEITMPDELTKDEDEDSN